MNTTVVIIRLNGIFFKIIKTKFLKPSSDKHVNYFNIKIFSLHYCFVGVLQVFFIVVTGDQRLKAAENFYGTNS